MTHWDFETKLVRPEGVGTWTFTPIPPELAKKAEIHARTRVKGTIDGVPVSSSVLSQGGGNYFIVVKKSVRDAVGKSAGDRVLVRMELDANPPAVHVPPELASALGRSPHAKTTFEKLAPSHRKAYAQWVDEAKLPETRARRVAKALEMIAAGKHL